MRGEAEAERYLKRRGYKILHKNAETLAGEADLVCEGPKGAKGSRGGLRDVVIVEVKARRGTRKGPGPEANITKAKLKKLNGIASLLRRMNGWDNRRIRIDVVTVEFGGGEPVVKHYQDVVGV